MKEQELKDLFSPHGDIAECYLSGKGFAFLRLVRARPAIRLIVVFTI